mmetsp:Transcript_4660/g.16110  ORF Transcript_4660/g.16110 Transcript_4660/m.16110 type:complete len:249 (+) Transcript_4660:372-1118(+)
MVAVRRLGVDRYVPHADVYCMHGLPQQVAHDACSRRSHLGLRPRTAPPLLDDCGRHRVPRRRDPRQLSLDADDEPRLERGAAVVPAVLGHLPPAHAVPRRFQEGVAPRHCHRHLALVGVLVRFPARVQRQPRSHAPPLLRRRAHPRRPPPPPPQFSTCAPPRPRRLHGPPRLHARVVAGDMAPRRGLLVGHQRVVPNPRRLHAFMVLPFGTALGRPVDADLLDAMVLQMDVFGGGVGVRAGISRHHSS